MSSREDTVLNRAQEQGLENDQAEALAMVARHSEFIGAWLVNNEPMISVSAAKFGSERTRDVILEDILSEDIYSMPPEEFIGYMRRFKMTEYTHIAASDLYYKKSVEDVTAHISAFASASVQAAYLYSEAELIKEFGEPLDEDGKKARFCVIGLGKPSLADGSLISALI